MFPRYVVVVSAALLSLAPAVVAIDFDCVDPVCPGIVIDGDSASTLPGMQDSPFSGFADPTLRRDPSSGRLWMAYSWPHIRVTHSTPERRRPVRRKVVTSPSVDIHLAFSDDGGERWQFVRKLWPTIDAVSPNGQHGHMSHEVANLLPVVTSEGTQWYGARLQYFLPDAGGFRERPVESFRILLGRASNPEGLSDAPAARLGSMRTDDFWGVDVNLAALSPQTAHCMLWNEPALHHDGEELFLALSCMAFHAGVPDLKKSDLVVFATSAEGDPSGWVWRYAGVLADTEDAAALGGERLTQIDLAFALDGALLAVVTPDIWDPVAGDFVHLGCRVVEVELRDGTVSLVRSDEGTPVLRATIHASDAGAAGTAACSYEPASSTGVIMTKRQKDRGGISHADSLTASLHRTGVHP